MKRLDGYGIRFVLLGSVAAVVLAAGGRAKADFTFGRPTNLGANINSSAYDGDPSISADGLELFFESRRSGGYGNADIYVSRRATKDDPWGPCMNIGAPVNTAYWDQSPSISADGLSLYFDSQRPGGYGGWDLWVTRRKTKDDPWEEPVNPGSIVNSSADDWSQSTSANDVTLYFNSDRAGGLGGQDLWFTGRATKNDPWGSPVNLGATVNSSHEECFPDISADSRMLFFSDHMLGPFRPGGYGGHDIWVTARATTNDPWGEPMNLGPVINSSDSEFSPNVSADGRTFYFSSDRPGGYGSWDIWQAPIIPIIDFNADEKVNIQDLLRLIESWGKDDPSVDIGPMPWGDGKVDEKDLELLMSYWGQEVNDPRLAACWRLDETAGLVAADRIGENDGTLHGGPIWQPEAGRTGGALLLDGSDDYVTTESVLDPATGPFSVFAWVKGGTPGQTIISQTGGADWLLADASGGRLRTSLSAPAGRLPAEPLVSESVITDGAWHCVGLVRDGSSRILYVDGVEVASDTQSSLRGSTGDMIIGAGSTLAPGSFWSGLIDDVRIYGLAVKP